MDTMPLQKSQPHHVPSAIRAHPKPVDQVASEPKHEEGIVDRHSLSNQKASTRSFGSLLDCSSAFSFVGPATNRRILERNEEVGFLILHSNIL